MSKTYLANTFSLNMLFPTKVKVTVEPLQQEGFCMKLEEAFRNESFVNAIGHDSTVYLVNKLCGTIITKNRVEVKLRKGDVALVIMISQRLEEGKVLTKEEITKMLEEGKISFYKVKV